MKRDAGGEMERAVEHGMTVPPAPLLPPAAGAEGERAVEYSMDASEQFETVRKTTESALNSLPRSVGDLTQKQYDAVKTALGDIRRIAVDHEPRPLPNYDMPVGEVKDIILRECPKGELFYPSDIAEKHGINYDTVDEAIEMLDREGRIAR